MVVFGDIFISPLLGVTGWANLEKMTEMGNHPIQYELAGLLPVL